MACFYGLEHGTCSQDELSNDDAIPVWQVFLCLVVLAFHVHKTITKNFESTAFQTNSL